MLNKYVHNVKDLSDNGGYKFRFHCERCQNGYESQYVAASANLLKTTLDAFSIFRPGWLFSAERLAEGIDRGLRGQEHDAAYERAVAETQTFFKRCAGCNRSLCAEGCWNPRSGMCKDCSPEAVEVAARESAQIRTEKVRELVRAGHVPTAGTLSCPICEKVTHGGKFCEHCGHSMAAPKCKKCGTGAHPGARFCAQCGGNL